jgi:aldehyde:ferredoxin oxidoreductase
VGARIVTLRKRYNVGAGWRPADDTLPDRFFDERLAETGVPGGSLGRARLDAMIRAYYRARGWSASGYPPGVEEAWSMTAAATEERAG